MVRSLLGDRETGDQASFADGAAAGPPDVLQAPVLDRAPGAIRRHQRDRDPGPAPPARRTPTTHPGPLTPRAPGGPAPRRAPRRTRDDARRLVPTHAHRVVRRAPAACDLRGARRRGVHVLTFGVVLVVTVALSGLGARFVRTTRSTSTRQDRQEQNGEEVRRTDLRFTPPTEKVRHEWGAWFAAVEARLVDPATRSAAASNSRRPAAPN